LQRKYPERHFLQAGLPRVDLGGAHAFSAAIRLFSGEGELASTAFLLAVSANFFAPFAIECAEA